jgi:hypothetical protein
MGDGLPVRVRRGKCAGRTERFAKDPRDVVVLGEFGELCAVLCGDDAPQE